MKCILTILLCLAGSTAVIAQKAPAFFLKIPNDNRPNNGPLGFYLEYRFFQYALRPMQECMPSSMGFFRFVVTKKATIDTVLISGNMPTATAAGCVRLIEESAAGWKPTVQNGKPVDTPMVACFFYEKKYTEEGCLTARGGSVSWYADFLLDLFKDGQEMIPAKNGYLIRPIVIESVR